MRITLIKTVPFSQVDGWAH